MIKERRRAVFNVHDIISMLVKEPSIAKTKLSTTELLTINGLIHFTKLHKLLQKNSCIVGIRPIGYDKKKSQSLEMSAGEQVRPEEAPGVLKPPRPKETWEVLVQSASEQHATEQ